MNQGSGDRVIKNKKITQFQFALILIHTSIGVSIVNLPHNLYMIAKNNSWISIILTGLIAQILIFIYGILIKRFPSKSIFEISTLLCGQFIGKIINFFIIVYFILSSSLILLRFSITISAWMMPVTPKWVLAALVVITSIYIAKENIQIISHFFLLTFIVFPIYFVFGIYALKEANLTYIFPIITTDFIPILKGVTPILFALQGHEVILFIFPFVNASYKGIIKTASFVNVFLTFFYTFIVIICLLILSPKELEMVPEPVLYIFKSFTFKVIERPDLAFTSMWIIMVVTSFVIAIYVPSLGLGIMFKKSRNNINVCIIAILSFALSLSITGIYEARKVANISPPFIVLFIFIIPLLYVIISLFKNKKVCDKDED